MVYCLILQYSSFLQKLYCRARTSCQDNVYNTSSFTIMSNNRMFYKVMRTNLYFVHCFTLYPGDFFNSDHDFAIAMFLVSVV